MDCEGQQADGAPTVCPVESSRKNLAAPAPHHLQDVNGLGIRDSFDEYRAAYPLFLKRLQKICHRKQLLQPACCCAAHEGGRAAAAAAAAAAAGREDHREEERTFGFMIKPKG